MFIYLSYCSLFLFFVGTLPCSKQLLQYQKRPAAAGYTGYTGPLFLSDECHSSHTVHNKDPQVCSDEYHWSLDECHSAQGPAAAWARKAPAPFWEMGNGKWGDVPLRKCANFFESYKRVLQSDIQIDNIRYLGTIRGGRHTVLSIAGIGVCPPAINTGGYGS